MHIRILLLSLIVGQHSAAAMAVGLAFVQEPMPQALSNSCQSYALSLALGVDTRNPTPIATPKDLRQAELKLRTALVAEAAALNKKEGKSKGKDGYYEPTSHAVWASVLPRYSSGKFVLKQQFLPTIEAVAAKVAEITGVPDVSTWPMEFSAALVKQPALVSFSRIGKDSYASGHIVAVLGVVPSPPRSPVQSPKLLLVNSAAKSKSTKQVLQCDVTAPEWGDEHYAAVTVTTSDYQLKNYGAGFSVMWLELAPKRSEAR